MIVRVLAIAAFLALARTTAALAQDAQVASGRTAFQVCAACHGTKPGESRLGPSLVGIAGRKAGGVTSYVYSPALAKGDFVWDDAHLSAFIAAPTKAVPGTKMIFRGVPEEPKRRAIIAYLKSLPSK